MKVIETRFDLMDKIIQANHGLKAKPFILRNLKNIILGYLTLSGVNYLLEDRPLTQEEINMITAIFTITLINTGIVGDVIGEKRNKRRANNRLDLFLWDLNTLGIDIELERLKKAELKESRLHTQVKLTGLLVTHKKYILLPRDTRITNSEDIYLLQEHVIGTEKWYITKSEGLKDKKLVLANNT